jgi:hypothetical protein
VPEQCLQNLHIGTRSDSQAGAGVPTGLEIPASTVVTLPSTGSEEDSLYGVVASSTATVSYLTIA